jgi:hypothetical protein
MPKQSKSPRVPSYRPHKASGQARLTLNGRTIYLCVYGSPKSRAEYEQVIGDYLARGRKLPEPEAPAGPTVDEAILAHW